jgi:hypothetical protein
MMTVGVPSTSKWSAEMSVEFLYQSKVRGDSTSFESAPERAVLVPCITLIDSRSSTARWGALFPVLVGWRAAATAAAAAVGGAITAWKACITLRHALATTANYTR